MIPPGFRGTAFKRTPKMLTDLATYLAVPEIVLQTVLNIEAPGGGFLEDGRPKILFERHVFHRRTHGQYDGDPDISNPIAGGYIGGAGEYERLTRALQCDPRAALMSASWGFPQIMGFNYELAGYADVEVMVEQFCASEDNQLLAFAQFLKLVGLVDELQSKDWAKFAEAYNGKGYRRNRYDTRLAAEHARLAAAQRGPDARADVQEVQAALNVAGYGPLTIDGFIGPKTKAAIRKFQTAIGLEADGIAGPATKKALFNPKEVS